MFFFFFLFFFFFCFFFFFFFFQAEDGIRDLYVTGVQTCALPISWYLAHMSAPDFEVIGGTLPGTPAIVLGRNRRIAWGMTNVAADVEDFFREHIDPSGKTAEFRGRQEPITIIPETIKIKGEPDLRLDVRVTRHGPLVSDALNANYAASKTLPKHDALEPLAFRWTALD